jgi:hypothetical protein
LKITPPLSAPGGRAANERATHKAQVERNPGAGEAHYSAERTSKTRTEGSPSSQERQRAKAEVVVHDEHEDEDDGDDGEAPLKTAAAFAFERSPHQSRPGQKQKGLFTPAWCDHVTGTLAEARVLGQLAHWFGVSRRTKRCRAKIERGGFLWIYKHYPQLARETRLTEKQVGDAVRKLVNKGLVVTCRDAVHGRLLRIDPLVIEELLLKQDVDDDQ